MTSAARAAQDHKYAAAPLALSSTQAQGQGAARAPSATPSAAPAPALTAAPAPAPAYEAGPAAVKNFLEELGADAELVQRVVYVVGNVSWSKQAKRAAGDPLRMTPELAVVMDADRLDSIGAVGVARCFTFGGTKKRALYSLQQAPARGQPKAVRTDGAKEDLSGAGHFYEKLLKIKAHINTEAGRREAEQRHAFLELFLQQLGREVSSS